MVRIGNLIQMERGGERMEWRMYLVSDPSSTRELGGISCSAALPSWRSLNLPLQHNPTVREQGISSACCFRTGLSNIRPAGRMTPMEAL